MNVFDQPINSLCFRLSDVRMHDWSKYQEVSPRFADGRDKVRKGSTVKIEKKSTVFEKFF